MSIQTHIEVIYRKNYFEQSVAEYETIFASYANCPAVDDFTIPDLVNVLAMEYKERPLAWMKDTLKANGLRYEQKQEMFERVKESLGQSDRQYFWAISNNRLVKDRRATNQALVKKIQEQDAFDEQLLLDLEV